jgi:hypothetical protein
VQHAEAEDMTKKILFICGSLNQTTMMHKIAGELDGCDPYFTPYYADGIENLAASLGWLDFTVLGGRHLRETMNYLAANRLPLDLRGRRGQYDLVVTCSDLIVQNNVRAKRLVLVQEGITEPETWLYHLVRWLKLPRYLANTATNGLSNAYDVFCVASEGYAEHFARKGVLREKIYVTGIPNFDDMQSCTRNDFPHHGHVLAVTSPLRETFRADDRPAFIRKCAALAAGRPLIFKLHPIENERRAKREILEILPHALVLAEGSVNHMIANASMVITQQSTSTFIAVGLGKETHTNLDLEQIRWLMPIQNGGASAGRIAKICRRVLHTPMPLIERMRRGTYRPRPLWENLEG